MHFCRLLGYSEYISFKSQEVKDSLERRKNTGGKAKDEAAMHIPKANDEENLV